MGCQSSRAANIEEIRLDRLDEIEEIHLDGYGTNSTPLIEWPPLGRRGTGSHPRSLAMADENSTSRAGRALWPPLDGTGRTHWPNSTIRLFERDNLNQLRSEMLTLERMFQTLIEQQMTVAAANTSSGCPPASPRAIENLPTIVVSDHDFYDGCNKECSICFLEFNINDKVPRLPCGHFFHGECINEWLQKKCTCPICRWELETEDRSFEIERVERMKSRRIRVKDHELDRLSIEGLQEMAGIKVKNRAKLIKTIKSLNNIDVITIGEEEKIYIDNVGSGCNNV